MTSCTLWVLCSKDGEGGCIPPALAPAAALLSCPMSDHSYSCSAWSAVAAQLSATVLPASGPGAVLRRDVGRDGDVGVK